WFFAVTDADNGFHGLPGSSRWENRVGLSVSASDNGKSNHQQGAQHFHVQVEPAIFPPGLPGLPLRDSVRCGDPDRTDCRRMTPLAPVPPFPWTNPLLPPVR